MTQTPPPEPRHQLDYAPVPPDADGGPLAVLAAGLRAAFAWWNGVPLYLRILIGLVLGVVAGVVLGPRAKSLDLPARLILQFLAALAPPLILFAVARALLTAEVRGRLAGRMVYLLVLNTLVAIGVGLLVANVLRPGRFARLTADKPPAVKTNVAQQLLDNIPTSLLRPFVENNAIGVVIIAVVFGFAFRRQPVPLRQIATRLAELGFGTILVVLHWVIALVPLAVFGKVASVVGVQGFRPFLALGVFILAVILALLIQACYYLTRVALGSWVRPLDLLRGTRDALVMAFSTASSTATMPVTYQALRRRVGLREESASLGALVGANFNNDGTALYEAMAALFVAQMLGLELTVVQQVMIVLTSVVASVGAAGIPEAGLVTMVMVFRAANLPPEYIPLLLPVDWFLDRCRTAVNVMGDLNVACLLDGKTRESAAGGDAPAADQAPAAAQTTVAATDAP